MVRTIGLLRFFSLSTGLSLFTSVSLEADNDFFETLPDGSRVTPLVSTAKAPGPSEPVSQPAGSLSGRIIFTSGGHGWTWDNKDGWFTQRQISHDMNEDYGNLDQMNHFIPYVFNAGATVVPMRPVGYQTNEVVLDNDSPGVTFSGTWHKSSSTIFYGSKGDVPYHFTALASAETATAHYTPSIPVAGLYPVYTWVRHGADRTSQLYRILHTGGESQIRVPHHMVGSGWIYLGTYYFDKGAHSQKGSVLISNLQPAPAVGAAVIADAIRFGNGMGDFIPAKDAPRSTYPREDEASRYWVARGLGQGQSEDIYNGSGSDQSDNVGAPPRLAREMNRETEGNIYQRIFISFHSNAGGGRGTTALWNDPKLFPGTKTPNQLRLAELIGKEVNDTLSAMGSPPLEVPWHNRTNRITYARNDYAFGEINNRYIRDEFDATILEVSFHDHKEDSKHLRDPKARDVVGLCSYRSVVRYMHEFDKLPLSFLPNPPLNPRAFADEDGLTISWEAPESDAGNQAVGYLVYRSENGYGFGKPVRVAGQTSFTLANWDGGKDLYFRVTAVNAAGESQPSRVVGCGRRKSDKSPGILFVNGFTEFSRFTNPRQMHEKTNYTPISAVGEMDRVIPRLNNAFDYVVPHGKALIANGFGFDSCDRESVGRRIVLLDRYDAVIWATGNQRNETLSGAEQALLAGFRRRGGHVFLSGAHIAQDLAGQFQSGVGDFLETELKVLYLGRIANRSGLAISPKRFRIWQGSGDELGRGANHLYFVKTVDSIMPLHESAETMFGYSRHDSPAAIRIDAGDQEGKVVYFGFPFETISEERARKRMMSDVLDFFF